MTNEHSALWQLIAGSALVALMGAPVSAPAAEPEKAAKPAEPLGRMFFTPAQRATLDVARARRVRTMLGSEPGEEVVSAPSVPQTITYDGVVRRNDGRTTFWINNRPINENEQVGGPVVGRIRPDGSVSLQLPQSGRGADLKVGQRIDLLTGTIEEPYSRKPAASAPDPKSKPGAKPAADKPVPTENTLSEREQEYRDQQRLQDAMRAVQDTAGPKPGAAPAAGLPQEPTR